MFSFLPFALFFSFETCLVVVVVSPRAVVDTETSGEFVTMLVVAEVVVVVEILVVDVVVVSVVFDSGIVKYYLTF
jgi:hypothetical protein